MKDNGSAALARRAAIRRLVREGFEWVDELREEPHAGQLVLSDGARHLLIPPVSDPCWEELAEARIYLEPMEPLRRMRREPPRLIQFWHDLPSRQL
jgi:hypothetical protein